MLRPGMLRVSGSGGVALRDARPVDLPRTLALLEAAGLPREGVAERFGAGYCVAETDGRLVGVAGVEEHGTDALLRSVAVAPRARGSGVGAALVRDRLARAAERGAASVFLLTTTAAGFFPRLGFRRVERAEVPAEVRASEEFAALCPAGAVVMRIDLAGSGARPVPAAAGEGAG
ncbi:MAG TPA: arsenic resistance N-acetyltransferase ArsN2 [Longimicrobiaceae bacterium]|nr:arsenic resistance N-acetyltransferase ArsN2 [Longimicrobiaceae bacterium]